MASSAPTAAGKALLPARRVLPISLPISLPLRLLLAAVTLVLLLIIPTAAAAGAAGKTSTASTAAKQAQQQQEQIRTERTANLRLLLTELNAIARTPWGGGFSPDSPSTPPPSPPEWSLHSVHSSHLTEHRGELLRKVPVYRTVRGYDEKHRRPVMYQTLVHEVQPREETVDRTFEYHLVLRQKRKGPGDGQAKEREKQEQEAQECLIAHHADGSDASEPAPSCSLTEHDPPSPLELLHVLASVSTDRDGHRAMTGLRSASRAELQSWWDAFLARHGRRHEGRQEHASTLAPDEAAGTQAARTGEETESARFARMQQQHLDAHDAYLLPIHARLQARPPPADADSPRRAALRVVSANIFNTNYWALRRPQLERVLREMDPQADIVAFQEVRALKSAAPFPRSAAEAKSSGGGEHDPRMQVSDLAAMLPGYEFAYAPAMGFRESQGEFVHEGLAIFSRLPLAERVDAVKLPRDPQDHEDFHQRIVLHARVRTGAGVRQAVSILNTHLSLSSRARTASLPVIAQVASRNPNDAAIVLGDMNAPADKEPALLLQSPFGFRDAWTTVHGEESEGVSEEQLQQGRTFHAWDPEKKRRSRIDLVLFKSAAPAKPDRAGTAAAASDPSSAAMHLVPQAMFLAGDVYETMSASPRFHPFLPLQPRGGVHDLRDRMYPSDHLFPVVDFVLRDHTGEDDGEQMRGLETVRTDASAPGAADGVQLPALDLPEPLVAAISAVAPLKDEL